MSLPAKNFVASSNWRPFWNVKILNTASIWHQKWKDRPKLCKKKYFHGDDVIYDVTERPQSRFSIFLYEWKNNIFHDNWRTYKDIIFKLNALMYHWIVNMALQTILDCFIDDVIGSQNRSKLWTLIALSIFELEHRSKAQNVTNAHGYFRSILNFRNMSPIKTSHPDFAWFTLYSCPQGENNLVWSSKSS